METDFEPAQSHWEARRNVSTSRPSGSTLPLKSVPDLLREIKGDSSSSIGEAVLVTFDVLDGDLPGLKNDRWIGQGELYE